MCMRRKPSYIMLRVRDPAGRVRNAGAWLGFREKREEAGRLGRPKV